MISASLAHHGRCGIVDVGMEDDLIVLLWNISALLLL